MVSTTTFTYAELRLQLLISELQSINDRSLKAALLNDIITFCVPQKYLAGFTIYGFLGEEAHMRLEVRIDYDEHDRQVLFAGDGLPDEITGAGGFEDGVASPQGKESRRHCPHMGKAVNLFVRLAQEKGLRLDWTVRFRENRREMCVKFGLTPAIIRDCTTDCVPSELTNSLYSEVSAAVAVSDKIASAG